MKIYLFLFSTIFLFLVACKTSVSVSGTSVPITVVDKKNKVDSIVAPYKKGLEKEMNEVIAKAEFTFERGRPNGVLNNWSTDALLHSQKSKLNTNAPVFSLLNWGGLRSSINKGEVTVGDIYKLMPFDNQVVFVELPKESLKEIADYLVKKGGEPIAGARLEHGNLTIYHGDKNAETFWVITSDYLMNGGDKMTFFEKKIQFKYANILLRDVFMEYAKEQNILVYLQESRINL